MSTIALHPPARSHARRRPRPTAEARTATGGQLRLTRRGQVVVVLAGLLAALALAVAFGAGSAATQEQGTAVPTEIHVVTTGETLWAIAEDLDAAVVSEYATTRDLVDRIEQMNGLETANLQIGQELRVPTAE
jgi:hypothetical protein